MRAVLIGAIVLAAWIHDCAAQAYPAKPVRMIINYPPGGPTDLVGRLTAQYLSEVLGQQVVVENRSGAGGTVGMATLAKSPPDGYTISLGANGEIAIAPNLYAKLPYDPTRDLAPISRVGASQLLLVVHPSLPAKSVKELIGIAKAKPGAINFASAGTGSTAHLCAELFKALANIDVVHVPYKGAGPALSELIGGQVEFLITGVSSAMPHVKAGRLRALGSTGTKRLAVAPDVPTIGETVRGYEANSWYGIFAPAGTPQPIIDRLHAELAKMVRRSDMKERLESMGVEPEGTSPAQLAAQVREEIAKWGKVVKFAKVKVE
jgi:tripartite-type tricarboxylate transporter receptor subunit TctC